MPPSGVGIVTSSRAVVVVGRPSRRRSNPTGRAHRGIHHRRHLSLVAPVRSTPPSSEQPSDSTDERPSSPARPPLIVRSSTDLGTMERTLKWLGVPPDGAVEKLSVICAHCNARLTPAQMDYDAVREDLHPDLAAVFRPLTRDDATNSFLMRSSRRPWVVNWAQSAACTQLRKFMSLTDANAMLGRGKMQVLTEAQARDLLAIDDDIPGDIPGGADSSPGMNPSLGTHGVLLDVGAGEGEVTETLRRAGDFAAVVATEASEPMVRRLRQKKFDLVVESTTIDGIAKMASEAGVTALHPDGFECVALLNVLDRCDTPFTLLSQLRALLRPGVGRLVLAVVIPFRPFVEDGKAHRPPKERLYLPTDGTWEKGVSLLFDKVLKPAGFKVERLARVPYICEGDQKNGAYILDDAVFVLSPASSDSGDEIAEMHAEGGGI